MDNLDGDDTLHYCPWPGVVAGIKKNSNAANEKSLIVGDLPYFFSQTCHLSVFEAEGSSELLSARRPSVRRP